MRSLKRILGTDLMELKTEVNDIWLSYKDIMLYFMKHLKQTAETEIDSNLESVVLGRPVHFQDFAPEADEKAEKVLEISSEHKILDTLKNLFETDKEKLKKYSVVLYEQARLLEGLAIENVTEFVGAMTEII